MTCPDRPKRPCRANPIRRLLTVKMNAIVADSGTGALRRVLQGSEGFATVVELVPWAGEMADARGQKPMGLAAALAGDTRVTALSVTDNAGGHARLAPHAPAEALGRLGHDVIVHVACRDRNRNALQSLGWDLLGRSLTTVLAISGDYPVEGYQGLARPVFDLDSVGLLALYRELGAVASQRASQDDPAVDPDAHRFFLGCAVDPFKRLEEDLIPQYLKLGLKVRAGADYAITQVGYDARRQHELLRWMQRTGIDLPIVANAYILDRGVARAFHAGRVPGCIVSDDLLTVVEAQAGSPDKGRSFFLEFAAKQLIVARGLGFRGIYLSGHRDAAEIGRILEIAESHDAADWRSVVGDVSWPEPGAFHAFGRDADGLASEEPDRWYVASRDRRSKARDGRAATLGYRVNRLAHQRVFEPGSAGFRTWASLYRRVERAHLEKPLHVLEQAVKVPLYDCRDCGDCSLPDVAYLCPESHCQKNQRNGPCGGAHDGMCEVPGHACIWANAYRRLKVYGEELAMLDRPPVVQDNELRRTSAWANTFLGRDHYGRRASSAVEEPAGAARKPAS